MKKTIVSNRHQQRKLIEKLMSENSKAANHEDRKEITKTLVGKLLGGCTASIKTNFKAWQAEIDAHHEAYGIKPGHNFRVSMSKRQRPHDTCEIPTKNEERLERIRNSAVGWLQMTRWHLRNFEGGEVVGFKVFKNAEHEVMEVHIKGITPGRSRGCRAVVKTLRHSRRTSEVEQRLFGTLVDVTLNWSNKGNL